jgi:c(7)-type cytochrome triheme protein
MPEAAPTPALHRCGEHDTEEESMTFARVLSCVVVVAVGLMVGLGPVAAQPKIPADLTIEKSKDSPGAVTFSHEKHKAAGVEKCTACHTKLFKMKKGQTPVPTMAKMKAGEACGACHDGKTQTAGKAVFAVDDKAKCETCHKKS